MRIIHNTTFIVEDSIEKEWVAYMQQHYLTPIRQGQCCDDVIFTRVSIDQAEGKNYSVQLVFSHEAQRQHFLNHTLPALETKMAEKYANRYLCFSSLLTEI